MPDNKGEFQMRKNSKRYDERRNKLGTGFLLNKKRFQNTIYMLFFFQAILLLF